MIANRPQTNLAEIKRTISLLYQPGDVVELRALDADGKPHAGYFNDFDKLAAAAARLSGTMMGVYLVLNPINKGLLARAVNRIVDRPKNLTADNDIISRRWFPIDVDANRAPGISSTDDEHNAAIITAKEIKTYLVTLGFPADSIFIGDSGNGAHLLIRVDMPNDAGSKALIESCIAAVKAKFESNQAIIDKTVFNAARIWKLYGTICKKGDSTEDRPHRTAKLIEVPNIVLAPTEALKVLAAAVSKQESSVPQKTYQNKGDHSEFELEAWMSVHSIEVTKSEPYNGGTRYILKACPFDSNHTGTSAAIFKMSNGAPGFKCQHNGCADNDWHKLREMLEPGYAERKRQYEQHEYENQAKTGTVSHHLTDMGNAERLIDKYGDKIHFSYERKLWLIWKGKYWKWDTGGEIMQLAHKVARSIYGEITTNDDEDTAKAKAKWAASSESNQRLCAMVAVAESMVSITIDQLDCDIWLLNCNNGTINLKTGVLQPHNPADLITRVISTNYNPDATSEEWVKFLKRTFGDKKELIAFCQRALGYSITGSQGEMAIFFCHGEGWNGKSTLLGACRLILGEYAAEVEPAAFMIDKNRGTGPNEAIASLYNVNFVTSTEIEEGQRLSTALLKRMTGGESLRCEHKFERGFNYKPRYKLWMSGNHEPEISDTTKSIKNRFKKVPFLFTISAAERVQHYNEVLAEKNSEAILAWLVKGCLEWQRTGLGEPSEVKEATQGYFDNQDVNIKGGAFAIYTNAGLTTPLSSATVLDFGDLRTGGSSTNSVQLWLKNTGTDFSSPTFLVSSLDAHVKLTDATSGDFVTGTAKPLGTWVNTTFTTGTGILTSGTSITAVATTFSLSSGGDWSALVPAQTAPVYAKFSDNGEIVEITNVTGLVVTIVRGCLGTTAQAHNAANPTCQIGTLGLAADGVIPLNLSLVDVNDLSSLIGTSLTGWNITIDVVGQY